MDSRVANPQGLIRGLFAKRSIRIVGILLGLLFLFPQLAFIYSMGNVEDPSVSSGDVNDFEFESFDASYQLSLEESGLSVLNVRETMVALFPERDHGLTERSRIVTAHLTARYPGRWAQLADREGQVAGEEPAAVVASSRPAPTKGHHRCILGMMMKA